MSRGLPVSILLHIVGLAVLAAYGSFVPQPPLEARRVMRVQLAPMPQVQPQVTQPAPEPEAQPPVQEPPREEPREPVPPPPAEPDLPPKQVPEENRSEPEKQTPPEPEPVQAQPQPREEPPAATEAATEPETLTAAGPAVSGTDVDFPFAWYLNRVEGIIASKWNPRQLGFREGSERRCIVHFLVGRAGQISQVTLVESSGVSLFDREALRAVKASRVPPLPAKFAARQLGVTFIFTLQSGT